MVFRFRGYTPFLSFKWMKRRFNVSTTHSNSGNTRPNAEIPLREPRPDSSESTSSAQSHVDIPLPFEDLGSLPSSTSITTSSVAPEGDAAKPQLPPLSWQGFQWHRLPVELMTAILAYGDDVSLARVSQASKALYVLVIPLLYSVLSPTGHQMERIRFFSLHRIPLTRVLVLNYTLGSLPWVHIRAVEIVLREIQTLNSIRSLYMNCQNSWSLYSPLSACLPSLTGSLGVSLGPDFQQTYPEFADQLLSSPCLRDLELRSHLYRHNHPTLPLPGLETLRVSWVFLQETNIPLHVPALKRLSVMAYSHEARNNLTLEDSLHRAQGTLQACSTIEELSIYSPLQVDYEWPISPSDLIAGVSFPNLRRMTFSERVRSSEKTERAVVPVLEWIARAAATCASTLETLRIAVEFITKGDLKHLGSDNCWLAFREAILLDHNLKTVTIFVGTKTGVALRETWTGKFLNARQSFTEFQMISLQSGELWIWMGLSCRVLMNHYR